jgi:hypothetical protein
LRWSVCGGRFVIAVVERMTVCLGQMLMRPEVESTGRICDVCSKPLSPDARTNAVLRISA